jgi:RNA polymerase sigma factor (sigma-70 family)
MSQSKSPVVPFFSNPLLQRFMQIPENRDLFCNVMLRQEEADRVELERRFAEFYYEMRFLGFVRKHIHYEALHVLRKVRKQKNCESLLLNSPISEDGKGIERIETIPDPRVSVENEVIDRALDLEDLAADLQLHEALAELTERQQLVLDLLYVKQMTEQEAASVLGVSQQSVNKLKKYSLNRIRRRLIAGAAKSEEVPL